MEDQILQIRKLHHEKYLNYLKNNQTTSSLLFVCDQKLDAIKKIQHYFKKKYLKRCINESDIINIPAFYRFRVDITNYHLIEYSEDNVEDTIIDMYRIIHQMFKPKEKQYLFSYCFDIREIYHQRNNPLELLNGKYYFQPNDHIRIEKLWKKINGSTSESIIFLSRMEYIKSLSIDKYGHLNYECE